MGKCVWEINGDFAEANRLREFDKKHPEEYASCFMNLKKVIGLLEDFGQPGAFHIGFLRSEGSNVWRIGQTGVRHGCETRLYVYLYVKGLTVYVLTIGDKSQQRKDIQRCKNLALAIEKERGNENKI